MTQLVVAAALVDAQRRVLMQQRLAGGAHGGLWEFPGGKVEPGEGVALALVRELAEELAIHVDVADCAETGFACATAGDGREIVLLLFLCTQWQGEPVGHAAQALAWVGADDLMSLPMPPADITLAQALSPLLAD